MKNLAIDDLSFVKNQLTEASRRTLANQLYHLLERQGCRDKDIINLSTELLSIVVENLKGDLTKAS